jgi:hypothetical protein
MPIPVIGAARKIVIVKVLWPLDEAWTAALGENPRVIGPLGKYPPASV